MFISVGDEVSWTLMLEERELGIYSSYFVEKKIKRKKN